MVTYVDMVFGVVHSKEGLKSKQKNNRERRTSKKIWKH